VDRWMALRMLRYVVRQVEHWRQQHPESTLLPVIIPLVMYHGMEGVWSAPRRVEELFDLPGEEAEREPWRALLPRFEYLLDDLTAERAEALLARPWPGWRGSSCATGALESWRDVSRTGRPSSRRYRPPPTAPRIWWWSSATSCGSGTRRPTRQRGGCYIQ